MIQSWHIYAINLYKYLREVDAVMVFQQFMLYILPDVAGFAIVRKKSYKIQDIP
tara:strand:+ start:529 stop:690 length:162 start_codon:yes stop_codon:yes gene_type:complete